MGIGPAALRLYEDLLDSGKMVTRTKSVLDLGSQDFVPGTYRGRLRQLGVPGGSSRVLMMNMGFESYTCVDWSGEHDTVTLDLNRCQADDLLGYPFDIVTNHGTTEHIFDQARCFRLIHSWTKPGGLMIHVLPTRGYLRHGFYVLDWRLFEAVARANLYEVVRFYDHDDQFGTLVVVVFRKREGTFPFEVPTQRGFTSTPLTWSERVARMLWWT